MRPVRTGTRRASTGARRALFRCVGWVICSASLVDCATQRPPPAPAPAPWAERLTALQNAEFWQLDGRAAVALGAQGWQASLTWIERGATTEVHLAGPLGVGAVVVKETPDGVSLNGAAPNDRVVAELQERLGFELPLADLRYWLVGTPAPDRASDLERNAQDRAARLSQDGWTVSYERYMVVGKDLLPARLVLTREAVRLRIAVDHWEAPR